METLKNRIEFLNQALQTSIIEEDQHDLEIMIIELEWALNLWEQENGV